MSKFVLIFLIISGITREAAREEKKTTISGKNF